MRGSLLIRGSCALLLAALLVVPHTGCVGFASTLMYWVKGNKVPARCTALEGKRVAIVCVSGSGITGPNNEGEALARTVGTILQKQVKKIELVRPEEVAEWRDQTNWDEIDFKSVGRGVKADMVVALNLESFSTHEDATILRGRAKVRTAVYDMTNKGALVFNEGPKEFVFPENGTHAVENETNFKRIYLMMLAQDIAKNFYAYEKMEDIARDALMN